MTWQVMSRYAMLLCLGLCCFRDIEALSSSSANRPVPDRDRRAERIVDLNTPRQFPAVLSVVEWRERAQDIRCQALFSCGLWPMPPKGPLNTVISGRMDRDGYSIEKVRIETYPGLVLAGNLYRPLGKGTGPFPAVLNPHGHWQKGRLNDTTEASIPARCANFAQQGMIAFSYDMVGYNDTLLVPDHDSFPNEPELQLWNISLMGLQTWNSIRALDFVVSLPGVDVKRIGCTGASGGGTQTFMLACVDERVSVSAPVVMVSHSMQGGCLCENAPGLRVEYSNMEIAASAATRPQILVAATGDWTKTTPTLEGPAISNIYRMLGKPHQFAYFCFSSDHNYNQTSREAVYAWFARWLIQHDNPDSVKELPYTQESDSNLRIWPDGRLPDRTVDVREFIRSLKTMYDKQWQSLQPRNPQALREFRDRNKPAWKSLVQLRWPEQRSLWMDAASEQVVEDNRVKRFHFGVWGVDNRLPASLLSPLRNPRATLVVLVDPTGQQAFIGQDGRPMGLARAFLEQRYQVLLLDVFQTGGFHLAQAGPTRNYWTNYYTTYNRTDIQHRVQDLVAACQLARLHLQARRVILCGHGAAGMWAVLAAPAAHAVIADGAQLDVSNDFVLLDSDLFLPGIRRLGGFEGVASLAAPNPLYLHNLHARFGKRWIEDVYGAGRAQAVLRCSSSPSDTRQIIAWAVQQMP